MSQQISRKPRVVIIEGIAASGKTTLQKLLKTMLRSLRRVETLSEKTTLMPLVENRSPEAAAAHLNKLISRIKKNKSDFVILDRFHFTHAFRTAGDRGNIRDIERFLKRNFSVVVVLLIVDEKLIERNIRDSLRIRKTWAKGKQGSISEKVAYYKDQQRKLSNIAQISGLSVVKINTSRKDWNRCAARVISHL